MGRPCPATQMHSAHMQHALLYGTIHSRSFIVIDGVIDSVVDGVCTLIIILLAQPLLTEEIGSTPKHRTDQHDGRNSHEGMRMRMQA